MKNQMVNMKVVKCGIGRQDDSCQPHNIRSAVVKDQLIYC